MSIIKIPRRQILKAAGSAAALAFAPKTLYAQSAMPEITTLRSTSRSWLWAVEDYGTAGGFFEEAGVRVVSNASNRGTNIAALQGGGVDVVIGAPDEGIRARGNNLRIRVIASMVNRYASHIVVKQSILDEAGVSESSPVEDKIAVLQGLNLGTTGPGAAPDALFRFLASLGGLDANSDFQLVPVQGGGAAVIAALQQGIIDGFCLSSPTSDMAVQREGCAYLFNMTTNPPPEMAEVQYIVASAGEDTIANKRDALVSYCRGLALAQRSIASEPEKFKAWTAEWFEGLDPEIFEAAFASNGVIFFDNPVPREDLYEKNLNYINTVNSQMGADPLPEGLAFENVVDPSIAREAMEGI